MIRVEAGKYAKWFSWLVLVKTDGTYVVVMMIEYEVGIVLLDFRVIA